MIDTTMHTNAVANYASRIRAARLDLGLSKAELARMSGVPRGMIGRIERGEVPMSLVPIERLARALGMKL